MGRAVRTALQRNRERANLSFLLAVTFFVVFSIIVLSEIFFIEDKNRSNLGHGHVHQNYHPAGQEDPQNYFQPNEVVYSDEGDRFIALLHFSGHLQQGSKFSSHSPYFVAKEQPLPAIENITAKDAIWQPVAGTIFKFYVYSAYLDKRGAKLVRVIAATKTRSPERVWCRFWSASGNDSQTVQAKIKIIRENWNLKYSAVFILCALPHNLSFSLHSVSIVHRRHLPLTNHLLIRNIDAGSPSDISSLAVCVKPLHFNYNRVEQLIEFIELNNLLGMTHLVLYNASIGTEAQCVLQNYINQGLVTLLPWDLNMVSQKEIRTVGLFAALNDCLYRSMYHYSYVAFIDLDEFIIPRQNYTLPALISWLSQKLNLRTAASYSFQNAFFYLQWPDETTVDRKYDQIIQNFLVLRKTRRKSKLNPHKQRSKYICRPQFVVEAGNHFVWEFIPGHGTLNVPSDVGVLHHYRVCEFGGDDCVKAKSILDQTAYKYADKLIFNFYNRYNNFSYTCNLQRLSFAISSMPQETGGTNYSLDDLKEMSQNITSKLNLESIRDFRYRRQSSIK